MHHSLHNSTTVNTDNKKMLSKKNKTLIKNSYKPQTGEQ